jgi:hypothetical protein
VGLLVASGVLLAVGGLACSADSEQNASPRPSDGGNNFPPGEIACPDRASGAMLRCSSPDVCCGMAQGENRCGAPSACGSSLILECDGPEDCDGLPCCWGGGDAAAHSTCATGPACETGAPLCRSTSECPSDIRCCARVRVNDIDIAGCITPAGGTCI